MKIEPILCLAAKRLCTAKNWKKYSVLIDEMPILHSVGFCVAHEPPNTSKLWRWVMVMELWYDASVHVRCMEYVVCWSEASERTTTIRSYGHILFGARIPRCGCAMVYSVVSRSPCTQVSLIHGFAESTTHSWLSNVCTSTCYNIHINWIIICTTQEQCVCSTKKRKTHEKKKSVYTTTLGQSTSTARSRWAKFRISRTNFQFPMGLDHSIVSRHIHTNNFGGSLHHTIPILFKLFFFLHFFLITFKRSKIRKY